MWDLNKRGLSVNVSRLEKVYQNKKMELFFFPKIINKKQMCINKIFITGITVEQAGCISALQTAVVLLVCGHS